MKSKLTFLVLIITNIIYAQQDAQYSQYMYNTISVNPAYAGSRDVLSILALHRSQWVGFEGAPRSGFFTLSVPLPAKRKQFLSQSRTVGKPSPRKDTDPNVERIIDRHLDPTGSPIKLKTENKASTFGKHRELAGTIPGISSHVSFNTDTLGGSTLLVHQPKREKPRAIFMDKIDNTQHMYVGIVPKRAAENKRSGHTTRQRKDAWHKRIQIRCNNKPGGIFHPDAPHSEHVAVGLEAIKKMVSERTKIIEKKDFFTKIMHIL